ncbi:hypothetical protein ABIQ69_11790 [Agromyces sp. G08B096]|uniref:O-antigen/teichoic acid export membrane protein n=1 Tax=Agromyces sp. G08B096 TaxID=3156399 RepID=A0AAU7W6D8_9MICO
MARAGSALGGAGWVLIGTAVGGGAGYLLSAFSGPALGASTYAVFAVFWSALYLWVSGASGIQQEVTRSAHRSDSPGGDATRRSSRLAIGFAATAAATVAVLVLGSSPVWSPSVFGADWTSLIWPLSFGVASYVIVTVVAGILYGLQLWRPIAAMVIVDGVLRLVLAGASMLISGDVVVVAWAVVIPFLMAPLLVWPFAARGVRRRFELDVDASRLIGNSLRTVIGAASTGVLISGFPLLLGATTGGADATEFAPLVFAINLTRAPIVVVVLALQSYLVVRFKTSARNAFRDAARLVGIVAVFSGMAAGVAWIWGEQLMLVAFGPEFALPGFILAGVIGSSAAIGALCVTGPLVLARNRHSLFTAGWVVAAVATVGLLLLPLPLVERAILALWFGPIAGLLVQTIGLSARRRWAPPPGR